MSLRKLLRERERGESFNENLKENEESRKNLKPS
jgi:hypothetical protein